MFEGLDPLLAGHIVAGLVALVAGAGAAVTRKGRHRHNRFGKTYVASMGVVVVTAVPLAVRIGSTFLLAIAVFSGYLVFAGYRVIARRRAGMRTFGTVDRIGHGTMVVAGLAMVGGGAWGTAQGATLAPVLVVFGLIGGGLAVRELRAAAECGSGPWISQHVVFMGGAYIATVTATVTVNLGMLPPLVRWLGPTAVGVPLLVYATRKYEPRVTPSQGTQGGDA